MKKIFPALVALASILVSACNESPKKTDENKPHHGPMKPMKNPWAHDPVAAMEDSVCYVFCTGHGVTCLSSTDMEMWTFRGACLDTLPEWARASVPDATIHFWAPDVIYHGGEWHLFYTISSFAKNTSVIGHATSPTLNPESPDYGWTDQGPVVRSVPMRDDWNAIDPNVASDDEGGMWMTFGSFWSGIQLFRLNDDLTHPAEPEEWYNVVSRREKAEFVSREPGENAVEAPFIFKKNGWYYMFVSFDYCCRGKESTYRVVVGRSRDILGPYIDRDGVSMEHGGGTEVIAGDGKQWEAVGHCSVYTFGDADYFFAHAYDMEKGDSHLVVLPVAWDEEWPVVSFESTLARE